MSGTIPKTSNPSSPSSATTSSSSSSSTGESILAGAKAGLAASTTTTTTTNADGTKTTTNADGTKTTTPATVTANIGTTTTTTTNGYSGSNLTPVQQKDAQIRQPVSWVKYYVLVAKGLDLAQLNPVVGQTRSNTYGDIPSFPDYQMVEVSEANSDPDAWTAYTDLNAFTPLAISNGHLELGQPQITLPSPEVQLQEQMSALMQAVQRNGWGVFATMPPSATEYGKELAALQSKSDLVSSDLPAVPADLVAYL